MSDRKEKWNFCFPSILCIDKRIETGVEGIFVTPNGAKAIYTIEGRKVKAMTPGQIYIMRDENGKTTKVLAR